MNVDANEAERARTLVNARQDVWDLSEVYVELIAITPTLTREELAERVGHLIARAERRAAAAEGAVVTARLSKQA